MRVFLVGATVSTATESVMSMAAVSPMERAASSASSGPWAKTSIAEGESWVHGWHWWHWHMG